MKIEPVYISVGKLFHQSGVFYVPKYQRSYAWGEEELEDFINDLGSCLEARLREEARPHFFGGIVSVEESIPGTAHFHRYQLVDGQQRIATFVIFMFQLIRHYEDLIDKLSKKKDAELKSTLQKRVGRLKENYGSFEIEVHRQTKEINKLELSKTDESFFQDLLNQQKSQPQKDSHKRLQKAFKELGNTISRSINKENEFSSKLNVMEAFEKVLDEDCSLIHIVTESRKVAYQLFQVLNDRGISLAEGDLLRAKTLEILEENKLKTQQEAVERAWDKILVDNPLETSRFLKWIYNSFTASSPGSNSLFDDFLDYFFPQHKDATLSKDDADAVVETLDKLRQEFDSCRKLAQGTWPYAVQTPIKLWDAKRLEILVRHLGHTNCIPLLLAACQLDPSKFTEIVQLTERFFFRYKLIINEHIGSLNKIYLDESKEIRKDPSAYSVRSYKDKLKTLQERKATDTLFASLISEQLIYNTSSGNKELKYFLLTAESYYRWYEAGAKGKPSCKDKNRIFDFAHTTIEHIYPKSTSAGGKAVELEKLKHKLGNLTILGPEDNKDGSNLAFDQKRTILQDSMILMNKKIAEKDEWDMKAITEREKLLKDLAMKVFKV